MSADSQTLSPTNTAIAGSVSVEEVLADDLLTTVLKTERSTKPLSNASDTSNTSELPQTIKPISLAKRPTTIAETGLSEQLLLQLLIKHILVAHVVSVRQLADLMALSGGIIQRLLDQAKTINWLENRQSSANGQMRYALSGIGRVEAEKALAYSGYLGVAPVPLSQYSDICLAQTSRNTLVVREQLLQKFSQLMLSDELISALGPALNSTKPILIYGAPGVGKSYLCRHLNLVFGDEVLIPSALEINNTIIQVFDPQIHILSKEEQLTTESASLVSLTQGHDPRWNLCQRPLIITGGELSEDMLEVNFDPVSRVYKAPLQLKANNGILLLDDLGRQKITPVQLFNRWIIPLEERRDFLSLPNGLHFEIPFELILLFSTNLAPQTLVDEAFLRRLGYKIKFEPLSSALYKKLWFQTCADFTLSCDDENFSYLLDNLHSADQKSYLPCYPRDLLCIVSDQIKFNQLDLNITQALLDFAWQHYFVKKPTCQHIA